MPRQKELDREIARLTCRFKSIDDVDCIYLTPFVDDAGKRNIDLNVVVVTNESKALIDSIIKDYNYENRKSDIMRMYNGILTVRTNKPDNYSTKVNIFSSREEIFTVKDILSSEILFDREGFYTRVATQFDNVDESAYKVSKYDNLIDFKIDRKLLLEFEPIKDKQ